MNKAIFEENETIELATETLTGDVRDFLLDRLRHQPKPWEQLTEEEQLGLIEQATLAANCLVSETVKAVASEGRKVITGDLEQVTVKDGIKAVIKLSKSDKCRHELIDSCGQAVLIVVADAESFEGEQAPAEADPDQLSFNEAA